MNWTVNDKPIEQVQPEREDTLTLAGNAHVRICYSPWPMAWLSVDLPHERCKFDANDREGTRRMVLRELLPLAEEALAALRKAVAEIDPDPMPCDDCDGLGHLLNSDGIFTQENCPKCDGTGRLEELHRPCLNEEYQAIDRTKR